MWLSETVACFVVIEQIRDALSGVEDNYANPGYKYSTKQKMFQSYKKKKKRVGESNT